MNRSICWTLMLVFLPAMVHAQPKSLTLDEAVALFRQNSLQQELARYDRLRKQGEADRYRAYPNPEISINREQLNAGPIDYQETSYMVSQPLELLGQPFLRGRSAGKSEKAAELQYEYDRLRLTGRVKTLYADYWQLAQKLEVYNRAMEVISNARSSAKARQDEGTFSGLQVQRFNVELTRYQKQRDQTELKLQETGNRLTTYLYGDKRPDIQIEASDSLKITPLPMDVEMLVQYALEHRPDLAALQQLAGAARLRHKVEKRDRLPQLNLNLGYKNQSDGAKGFVVGGSIELPFFNRNSGEVTVSRARTRSRQTELTLKKQTVRNQVEATYREARLILDRWKTMQENGTHSSMLESARAAYRQGRYSLVALLDATSAYVEGRTMLYETIAGYNRALFKLDVQTAGHISENQNP